MVDIFKKDIPEIPSWVAISGDNTDSWFFQQLARFASQRASTGNNVVLSGQFIIPHEDLVLPAKPVILLSFCPNNIGTAFSYARYWADNVTYVLTYDTSGPTYEVTIITATTLSSSRIDNGDGTWTLDTAAFGYGNSTTDPDYYAVFLQT